LPSLDGSCRRTTAGWRPPLLPATASCPSYWWNSDRLGSAALFPANRRATDSRRGHRRTARQPRRPFRLYRCHAITKAARRAWTRRRPLPSSSWRWSNGRS